MLPGTTPNVILRFKETSNFEDISKLWVTFKSKITEKKYEKTFEKEDCYIDELNKTITIPLTQEETLKMSGLTEIEIQVRIKYNKINKVFGTKIKRIPIDRLLKGGIM